jgi:hypothetical protein
MTEGKSQTTIEMCEWNPSRGRAAYTGEPSACRNEATWCVGASGQWHLCYECAAYPSFARLKKTPLPKRRIRGEPFEMLNGDEQRHG